MWNKVYFSSNSHFLILFLLPYIFHSIVLSEPNAAIRLEESSNTVVLNESSKGSPLASVTEHSLGYPQIENSLPNSSRTVERSNLSTTKSYSTLNKLNTTSTPITQSQPSSSLGHERGYETHTQHQTRIHEIENEGIVFTK